MRAATPAMTAISGTPSPKRPFLHAAVAKRFVGGVMTHSESETVLSRTCQDTCGLVGLKSVSDGTQAGL